MANTERRGETGTGDRDSLERERSHSEASLRLWPGPDLALPPLLERSCSDCGVPAPGAGAGGGLQEKTGKIQEGP